MRFRDYGYAVATIIRYLRIIAHFGEWLDGRKPGPSDCSEQPVSNFLDHHLPQCRCRVRVDRRPGSLGFKVELRVAS